MPDPYDEIAHWLEVSRKNEPNDTPEMRRFREALQREFEKRD